MNPPPSPAADLIQAPEEIAPGCALTLTNPLIHTNASALQDPAWRRFLFWINTARDVIHPPIQLGRYPAETFIDGDGPFHILAGNTLVADHLVPNYPALAANHAHLLAARPRAVQVAAPCVFACHPGVNVWSHWLIDTLPRILLAEQACPGRFAFAVPASITEPTSPRFLVRSILDSLATYGIAPHRLLRLQPGTIYRFSALFDLTGLAADGMHPAVLHALRNPKLNPPSRKPTRLLAAIRAPGEIRPIVNHAEIVETLRRAGAEFQDPATTPFAEKLAAFRDAETVVGDLGSNLATAVFASPDAAIATLAPAGWRDNYFAQIFQRLAIRHADIRGTALPQPGDAPGHHAHFVPPHHLQEGLAACRAAPQLAGPVTVDSRAIARTIGPTLLRIDFAESGNAPDHRSGEFSSPEATHTWSLGPSCALRIPRRKLGPAADLWLEIKGIGFIAPPHLLSRPLAIEVNGHKLAEFDIDELTHLHVFIPRDLTAQLRGTLHIAFHHPVCPSPRSMGVSADTRPLGFMFEFVAIRESK